MLQTSLNFQPFAIAEEIRTVLTNMLKPWSRVHIAQRIQTLTDHPCSEATLNNWTASSSGRHAPAWVVPAASEATQKTDLYSLLAKPCSQLLISDRIERLARLTDEKRRIESQIVELGGTP